VAEDHTEVPAGTDRQDITDKKFLSQPKHDRRVDSERSWGAGCVFRGSEFLRNLFNGILHGEICSCLWREPDEFSGSVLNFVHGESGVTEVCVAISFEIYG
jgi:hypothetical protein